MRIAIFCHMYYPGMFAPLKAALSNVPVPSDVFLSTTSEQNKTALVGLFSRWPGKVDVRIVENRGRDIAPKLVTFGPAHKDYDLVLHTHTKGDGTSPGWREHMLSHVVGSEAVVAAIIRCFEQNPALGILAPVHYPPIRPWIKWGDRENTAIAEELASRAGMTLIPEILDFPSGSMFWARPAALAPLLDLNLSFQDFPPEAGQRDGTPAHAIERLIYYAADSAGFAWEAYSVENGSLRFSSHPMWPSDIETVVDHALCPPDISGKTGVDRFP